jgi:hypothetical protein
VDGHLEKVTADDPRFDEWRKTKGTVASRKKALLKANPLEYARTFGVKAASTRAERAAGAAGSRGLRAVAKGAGAFAPGVATALGATAAVTAGFAILAAGYVVSDRIAKNQGLKLGARLNAISEQFIQTQNAVIVRLHARSWGEVPQAIRDKAVLDYKRALSTAAAQAQGSAFVGSRAVGSFK